MPAKVLLVEDDNVVRELLVFHLSKNAFEVLEAQNIAEAWLGLNQADIIVLDWMLPDGSGLDWLEQIRADYDIPVLMLTARASELDKVTGLKVGADDYLTKPFSNAELLARIEALLRRSKRVENTSLGKLQINTEKGIVEFDNKELSLTRREYDLLLYLTTYSGRIFSRTELLDKVWGDDFMGTERTVDQHISQLRVHLSSSYIETIRGRGYRLVNPENETD